MTKKQIEVLKRLMVCQMSSDYLTNDQKVEAFKNILDFLTAARDLYLIDEKQRARISKEIGGAGMEAYDSYNKAKEA